MYTDVWSIVKSYFALQIRSLSIYYLIAFNFRSNWSKHISRALKRSYLLPRATTCIFYRKKFQLFVIFQVFLKFYKRILASVFLGWNSGSMDVFHSSGARNKENKTYKVSFNSNDFSQHFVRLCYENPFGKTARGSLALYKYKSDYSRGKNRPFSKFSMFTNPIYQITFLRAYFGVKREKDNAGDPRVTVTGMDNGGKASRASSQVGSTRESKAPAYGEEESATGVCGGGEEAFSRAASAAAWARISLARSRPRVLLLLSIRLTSTEKDRPKNINRK